MNHCIAVVDGISSVAQIDEQDAEERAELRRKQIESANKMLYDDTDRPKKLHSKMLLSDVMQERVAQMDYAQQIKALKRHQDEAFLVQQAARLKVLIFPVFSSSLLVVSRLLFEDGHHPRISDQAPEKMA